MRVKKFKQFIKESVTQVGEKSDMGDGWEEHTIHIPPKEFFNRFYPNKKLVNETDDYYVYEYHNKQYDEKEDEYFWEKKSILKVEKREDITHYYIKNEIDRPLYKVRDPRMTREQELTIRIWCGTKKNPKQGRYVGYENGLAMMKSYLSNKEGKLYHILPNGDILEMLDEEKVSDQKYIEGIIDYLLDNNPKLIQIVHDQILR